MGIRKRSDQDTLVVGTRAGLPTGATVQQNVSGSMGMPTSCDIGTIAYVADQRVEVIFDGVTWHTYSVDVLHVKTGATFPSNPFDGARIKNIVTGDEYVAIGGVYEKMVS